MVLFVEPGEINSEEFLECNTEKLFLEATHFSIFPVEGGFDEVKYYVKRKEAYPELKGGQGYVYVLECTNQPGICKIGSTTRTPADRVREINAATGVIVPWMLSVAYRCTSPVVVEKLVHKELEKYRVNSHKEGFNITLSIAKETIERILEICEKS